MSQSAQNYANHGKLVPGYHFVNSALLLVLLGWAVREVARGFSLEALVDLLLVVSLVITAYYARTFGLGVQDRVIRLEERLRMAELLPDDLKPRIQDFTMEQLVGLRFASDEELPALARRVLDEGMSKRKQIKMAVKDWRADDQRI